MTKTDPFLTPDAVRTRVTETLADDKKGDALRSYPRGVRLPPLCRQ